MTTYDRRIAVDHIARCWADEVVPALERYIALPALSPAFDADWAANGHLGDAVELVRGWIESRPIEGLTVSIHELDGRTPVVVAEIEPFGPGPHRPSTTLLYGHLDKQPEMEGWRSDLGPWTAVREGDRLYGRGGADDGYSSFAALTAIEAVQRAGGSHGRCVVLIEASEESGSPDLPAHVGALADRLGQVDLVVCLDSGCGTYDTLWLTSSLRGMVGVTVRVDVIERGMHSGAVGGLVPSSFRILRQLLDRIEDAETGAVLLPSATVSIPDHRVAEARGTADALPPGPVEVVPFVQGASGPALERDEALLARTWTPSLAYVGADGLPPVARAGNVLRPYTSLKLSLRLPPTADPGKVAAELTRALETDPPYGARVTVSGTETAWGWDAPALEPWLHGALQQASVDAYGQPMQLFGEGGTIPFMAMLGDLFPQAQFVVTGVLGPESNAHGPNEFLHLAYAERLTCCLADVLVAAVDR